MIEVEEAVRIALPREQVFAVAALPENMTLWNPAVLESQLVGEIEPGARVVQSIRLMGRRFVSEFEVTAFEPPRRVTYSSIRGPVRIEGTMRFEALPGETLVSWTVAGDGRRFFRVAESVLLDAGRRQMRACLENLKRVVEASVAPGPGATAPLFR